MIPAETMSATWTTQCGALMALTATLVNAFLVMAELTALKVGAYSLMDTDLLDLCNMPRSGM